jgi:hypothetical protein
MLDCGKLASNTFLLFFRISTKLFDLLLYVSGLGKNIGTNKDENITELKDRLKLVESQIKAGDNNPVVKKEMKEITQKLYLYKVISHNNGKSYLKQF